MKFLTQIKISCVSKLLGTKNNGNTSLSNRKKNKSDPFQILFSDRVKQKHVAFVWFITLESMTKYKVIPLDQDIQFISDEF